MKIFMCILFLFALATPVLSQCDKEKWQQVARDADLVIEVEVEEVKDAPGFWSGHIAAIQNIRFKVIKALKGKTANSEIELEYYVVNGSPLADVNEPRLSPKIFKTGNQLVLFLKANSKDSGSYFTVEKNLGTLTADSEILKSLSL